MVCLQRPCPRAFASARQVARCARAQRAASVVVQARTQVVDDLDDEDDVDKAVAEFLRAQDASERGIEERQQLDKVVGSSEVDDETAKALCRDVTRILRLLKSNRDMDENEAKLIIQVEDPRNEDARKMGVEVASGVSRDELALALDDVCEGRIPKDRIALRVLKTEMSRWPFLEQDAAASDLAPKGAKGLIAQSVEGKAESAGWRDTQARPPMGRDATEKSQGLQDDIPAWMGYGTVYAFTLIPVFIFGTTIAILFYSSLK